MESALRPPLPTATQRLRGSKSSSGLTNGSGQNIIVEIRGSRRRVADIKSESRPASNRNRWPASYWNAWPASSESAEEACKPYYAPRMGAPSLPPGRYFRMHMIGYFEGIDSERGPCVALRGFVLAARFRTSRGSRSFMAVAHALSSAARGARDGVRLGAEARGRARPCEGRADRRRRLDDGGQRRVAHDRTIARY